MVRKIFLLMTLVSAAGLTGCATPVSVGHDVAGNFGYGVGYAIGSAARDVLTRAPSLPERAPQRKIRPRPLNPNRPVVVFPYREPGTPSKRHTVVPTPAKTSSYVATKNKGDSRSVSSDKAKETNVDCPLENVW